jgi:hypothetical protein
MISLISFYILKAENNPHISMIMLMISVDFQTLYLADKFLF